jgi:myo-inositol-1(or 4)-monophosphatase
MAPSPLLTVMINAARKGARAIRRDFGEVERLQVSLKGPANFVTKADQRAEQVVREELMKARPTYGYLGEETGEVKGTDGQHRWVVDPIDGTTNFIHGIPHFAVSIGLERAGEAVAGIVYNPVSDELFAAEKGRGAFLNDRRLRVASRKSLSDSVLACGIPHLARGNHPRFRAELTRIQAKAAGIRRFGAAALDLCWIAAGRIDGYWERGLQAWDLCAGICIVREAGGMIGDCDSSDADALVTGDVLAANGDLFGQIRAELLAARKDAAEAAE